MFHGYQGLCDTPSLTLRVLFCGQFILHGPLVNAWRRDYDPGFDNVPFLEPLMFVVSVTIFVKPEHVDAFIAATLDNATNTRKEPGNIRFDVLRGTEDTSRFLLYEVYKEPEDFAKHQQTAHYFRWRDTAVPLMREPRVGVKHMPIFYGDAPV